MKPIWCKYDRLYLDLFSQNLYLLVVVVVIGFSTTIFSFDSINTFSFDLMA